AVSASDFERRNSVTATNFEHAHTVAHKGRENFDFDLLGNDVARAGPLPEAGPVVPKGEHVAVIFNFDLHIPFLSSNGLWFVANCCHYTIHSASVHKQASAVALPLATKGVAD